MSDSVIENAGIVPIKEKLAYSFAQMPGTFYGGVMGVIQSFYFAWMGLSTIWITIALIVYAAWNVVNDPIFGNLIGNTANLSSFGSNKTHLLIILLYIFLFLYNLFFNLIKFN